VTRGETFEELRPLLFAIAYRILGSVAEAEDAVQETWLRYQAFCQIEDARSSCLCASQHVHSPRRIQDRLWVDRQCCGVRCGAERSAAGCAV
jgi:hypothetical protein